MKKNSLAILTGLAVAGATALGWVLYDRLPHSGGQPPASSTVSKEQAASKPAAVSVQLTPEPAVPDKQPSIGEKSAPLAAITPQPNQQNETPGPDSALTSDTQKPRFDTVRVETMGDAVVAGRATPRAEVTLKRNGEPIGKTVANEEGDWVLIPDSPLPKGSSDLSLEQKTAGAGPAVMSDQSVAVVVPKGPGEKTMIALVEPGKPTKVLQKAEVAAQGSAAPPGTDRNLTVADAKPQIDAMAKPAEPSAPAKEPAVQPKSASAEPPEQKIATDRNQQSSNPEAKAPIPEPNAPAQTKLTDQAAPAQPKEDKEDKAAGAAKPPPTKMATAESEPQPSPKVPEPKTPEPMPVSLDAVDYDAQGNILFSGSAQAGASVRLYVDNAMVGDARADAQGRWLFLGNRQIRPGTHSLRVDDIDLSGRVKSRIELPFMREEPARIAEIEPQSEPVPAPTTEQSKPEPAPASEPAKDETADGQPKPATNPMPEQPQATAEAEPEPRPAVTPESQAELPAVSKSQPEATVSPTPTPSRPEPAKSEQASGSGEQKTMARATPTAQTVLPRNGRVVIQPGNNLWRLSRVVYGKGVLFTVIYEANKSQIRNPDLIYPGQIFATPNATPPESIDPKRREPLTAEEGASAVQ